MSYCIIVNIQDHVIKKSEVTCFCCTSQSVCVHVMTAASIESRSSCFVARRTLPCLTVLWLTCAISCDLEIRSHVILLQFATFPERPLEGQGDVSGVGIGVYNHRLAVNITKASRTPGLLLHIVNFKIQKIHHHQHYRGLLRPSG